MISILSGIIILGIAGVALWYFMPHKGQLHWHTQVPFLDSLIPVVIVSAFAIAVATIIAGVVGMST